MRRVPLVALAVSNATTAMAQTTASVVAVERYEADPWRDYKIGPGAMPPA